MIYLTDLIMVLLEAGTSYLVFEYLFQKREARQTDYRWFYIVGILLIYGINVIGMEDVNFLCNIVCYIVILSFVYKVTVFEVLFWITTIVCANISIEICTYFVTKVLLDATVESRIFWTWFSINTDVIKGIVFLGVLFCISRMERKIYINLVAKIIMLIGTFIICNLIIKRFSEEQAVNLLTINIPVNCLVINFVLIVVLGILSIGFWCQMEKERNEKQELAFEKVKSRLQEQHYQNVQKINVANRQFVHNMHHYFDTIRMLAAEENTTQILALIGEIDEIYDSRKNRNYCEDPIVNAILLDKAAKCEEEHIEFEADVELGLDFSSIRAVDLVTILGNLYENAIEANMKCSEDVRRINLRIFKPEVAEYIIFEMSNYFNGRTVKKGMNYLTTKKEKESHGIGLKSIETIVAQYNGMMNIAEEGHTFKIQIMLGEVLD